MSSLTLKPRNISDGAVYWHDAYVLQIAIERIAENKPISKIVLWLSIAGKIQYALESDDDFGGKNVPNKPVTVELSNLEARKLWEELCKLEPKQFGRDVRSGQPASPNPGVLSLMLKDIAEQFGFELVPDET